MGQLSATARAWSLARDEIQARVVVATIALFAVAIAVVLQASSLPGPARPPFGLSFWVFALGTLLTESLSLHVDGHRKTHLFNLSDVPLAIGFFFASPLELVSGCLLGHALHRLTIRRQNPFKLACACGGSSAASAIAVAVFRLLGHSDSPVHIGAWLPVIVAISVNELLGLVGRVGADRWDGGSRRVGPQLALTGASTAINSGISLMAITLLWAMPASVIWLAVTAVAVTLTYGSYASLRQRYASLQLLYEFTRVIDSSVTAETVIYQVLDQAHRLLRADRAEILLLGGSGGPTTRHVYDGEEGIDEVERVTDGTAALMRSELWQQVVETRQPVVVPRKPRDGSQIDLLAAFGAEDCLVAPLLTDEGVVGTIMVGDRPGDVRTFDQGDLQLFATLANHASVAFTNSRLIDQLRKEAVERRWEALHDGLTKLANRQLFLEVLAATAREATPESPAAVMLMDLNRFKEVNDTLGHHAGDVLLQQVADRIIARLRRQDFPARLGGDEFAILIPNVRAAGGAVAVGKRIISALESPFMIHNLSIDIGASIGIAVTPNDGRDPSVLLQRADVAMYDAKASGGSLAVYNPEADTNSPRRLALAGELREAIGKNNLTVYYQPKARVTDGEVVGVEALVRWNHKSRGLIPPDEFIPISEKTGLIQPLTMYVIEEAIAAAARWRRQGLHLEMAINLSVRCLMDTQLPSQIAEILSRHSLPASAVTLEITESVVMSETAKMIAVLERLASVGVRLSVDDFGTGYSSLSYLQGLPVHELKVDRSFVQKMATDHSAFTIVESIIEMGHNLGLETVAEGVEDGKAWHLLRAASCDIAQGYLLSPPVPERQLLQWITRNRGPMVVTADNRLQMGRIRLPAGLTQLRPQGAAVVGLSASPGYAGKGASANPFAASDPSSDRLEATP